MAIPLIIGGIVAAVSGVAGAGAYLSAKEKKEEAQKIYESKSAKQERAGKKLETAQKKTTAKAEDLGLLKLKLQQNELARFISLYERLGALNITGYLNDKFEFEISLQEIREMKRISMSAAEVLSGGVQSLAAGALAGAGMYSAVMTLGAASTGTAISALSGVAATNATLAWLGGGSLVTGGMGVAGGMATLSFWVAGPALLVAGAFADSKAEQALTEAKKFGADVDVACEKMKSETALLAAIATRCSEFEMVLNELKLRINPSLEKLASVVARLEGGKGQPNDSQLKSIHSTLLLAKALKDIMNISVVGDDGKVNTASRNVKKYLEKVA